MSQATEVRVAQDQIAIALDTSDWDTFARWCVLFGPRVGVLKVGLEAFVRWGPRAVEIAREHAVRVFLDVKLHDIPNTVGGAVDSARSWGVDLLTVHAGGGERMLRAASEAAGSDLTVLGVTVLTHLDADELARLNLPGTAAERALAWAQLAVRSGCGGAVCSPRELPALRSAVPESFQLVTPGIRPRSSGEGDDQRRTATPREAVSDGANLLVVGRPVTQAEDPVAALEAILS